MINVWKQNKEVEIYCEHKVHIPIVAEQVQGQVRQLVQSIEVQEDIDMDGIEAETVRQQSKLVEECTNESSGSESSESESEDGEGELGDERVYMVSVRYLSDGDYDEELQLVREERWKSCGKGRKRNAKEFSIPVEGVSDDETDPLTQILKKKAVAKANEGEAGQNKEDGYESDYYNSDDFGSLCSSDEEHQHVHAKRRRSRNLKYNSNSEYPEFALGMVFVDCQQFREAIKKYSRKFQRELKFMQNDRDRVRVKCMASARCKWEIFASLNKSKKGFQVKGFQEEHNCALSFSNKLVNVDVIAKHFHDDVMKEPHIRVKDLQARAEKEFKVNINFTRARRAKKKIMTELEGNVNQEFAMLRDYAEELLDKNEGSTIKIHAQSLAEGHPHHFLRMYICFDALKKGWKAGCMERIVIKRKFGHSWKNNYGHLVKEKLDAQKKDGIEWRMTWNGGDKCEVKKGGKQYIVNLNKQECSCRLWQISGLPCAHACCAIWHIGGDPDDYISTWYYQETYLKAYDFELQPINGSHEWKRSALEPVVPPINRKMPGRPKKARRKAKDEPKKKGNNKRLCTISKKGVIMACRKCGGSGHNKATCKSTGGQASITGKPRGRPPPTDPVCSNGATRGRGRPPKEKGPGFMSENTGRPKRTIKPTAKGYGIYTNLKTGEQSFMPGLQNGKFMPGFTLAGST